MSNRTVLLREAWRQIEYADLSKRLAETEKQLAEIDPRTILLLALRRAEHEVERIRSLMTEQNTTGA
jgi:hypothetical protein